MPITSENVAMRKGQPNHDRVSQLHERIFGTAVRRGEGGDTIHAAQQLVYLEESCQDILETIRAMESATGAEYTQRMDELRDTLTFVARFADDRKLLQTLTYQQKRK
jgi:hypothetical protein